MVGVIIAAFGLLASVVVGQNCTTLTQGIQLQLSEGYASNLILNGLSQPRDLVFDNAGNLLIVEQAGAGVRRVVLGETADGSSACVVSSKQLIADATNNHGIALSKDGKTLFVSTMADVKMYPYDAAAGSVGAVKTVISGMRSGGHITRTLLIPSTASNYLLVSRGSDGNIDNSTIETSAAKSIIKAFQIDQLLASTTAVPFTTGGEVLGWGLRNSVGVGEDPSTGGIWSVENSADNVARSGVDIHGENPAEELNYHGTLTDTNTLKGANYGYPVCFAAWQATNIPSNTNITVGTQFGGITGTPYQQVSGATAMTEVDNFCRTQREEPRIVFPSHTAPLDVKFNPDGSAAYVSFHGSWNRSPPDGYRVGKIPFSSGQPVSSLDASSTAVEYILQNTNLSACPNSCVRPVGLGFDGKGRLFMTSDTTGELYVITGPFLRPRLLSTKTRCDDSTVAQHVQRHLLPVELTTIGGGIIGCSTAYFLIRHPSFDPSRHRITLLEAASTSTGGRTPDSIQDAATLAGDGVSAAKKNPAHDGIAGAASGKAGGLLALWAFPQNIVPLSFRLHDELAREHGGQKRWGYRRCWASQVDCQARLPPEFEKHNGNNKGTAGTLGIREEGIAEHGNTKGLHKDHKKDANALRRLGAPEDLDWVDTSSALHTYDNMGAPENTAQMHPELFTRSMAQLAEDAGVTIVTGARVTSTDRGVDGKQIRGVTYVDDKNDREEKSHKADFCIIAAGPWTRRLLPEIPVKASRAHSINVEPEIYARPDGTAYACGPTDNEIKLPATSADVEVDVSRCDDIAYQVGGISDELGKDGEVIVKQACYLPQGGPFIGEVSGTKRLIVAAWPYVLGHTERSGNREAG